MSNKEHVNYDSLNHFINYDMRVIRQAQMVNFVLVGANPAVPLPMQLESQAFAISKDFNATN